MIFQLLKISLTTYYTFDSIIRQQADLINKLQKKIKELEDNKIRTDIIHYKINTIINMHENENNLNNCSKKMNII